MHKSPFKFLDSYTKDDRHIFFGRDREIEELFQKVYESRLIIVYGVSGTGKTSLVNCGLANKIPDTDWLPLNVRRGQNIMESTARAISEQAVTPLESSVETPAHFKKSIRSLYLDHYKPLFFIFDQFEELFIFGSKDEKAAFVSLVKELVDSELQCRFLFVMREEYLAAITEFEKHIPGFLSNRIRIEKMTPACAREAIEGPCKAHDIKIDDGFAAALLEKLSQDSAEVELTYLQVFLDKVFRLAADEAKIGERLHFHSGLLKKAGNVSDLLGSFLDEQIDLLDNPDTALAVLKSFVSVKGTKRQMSVEEVMDYARTLGKPIQEPKLQELLQTLIQLRILRDKDQNNRYELRHDALATTIYEKITLVEKELLEIRHLIENAYNNWERRGVLLSPEDLAYIAAYESRIHLSKHLAKFLETSKLEAKKRRLRRRNLAAALVMVLLLVMAGFTYWALGERSIARDNERKALAEKFNFLAQDLEQTDPTKALRVAEHALSLDPDNRSIYQNLQSIYYDNSFYRILFEDDISALDISPNGEYILSGSHYGTLKLWDSNGNIIQGFSRRHLGAIFAASLSPCGNYILTASSDRIAKLWDLNGNELTTFSGHKQPILTVAFSPSGDYVLTGSIDNTARLWDLEGNILLVLSGHKQGVTSAVFSPDGQYVLTGSWDHSAKLWDLEGNEIQSFLQHENSIWSVAFSPDQKYVFTGYNDGSAQLWDLDGKELINFSGHRDAVISAVFSPNGQSILTGSFDMTARLWDLHGNQLQLFSGHEKVLTSAFFSPCGKYVFTGSRDGSTRLWKVERKIHNAFVGHKHRVRSVALSPDEQHILTGSIDRTARIWDLEGNEIQVFLGHLRRVNSAVFSSNGKHVLTSSDDGTAKLWDLEGNEIQNFSGHLRGVNSAVFSSNDKHVLSGSDDGTAKLWDIEGNELQVFSGHQGGVTSVDFSPDGQYVLTGSEDKTARLWNLQGNTVQVFFGHREKVTSAAFSSCGEYILTGSEDFTARLWTLEGNHIQVFAGHGQQVESAVFSPDSRYILTGSIDNTARLWDLEANKLKIFAGHEAVFSVAFSASGNYVLTGSEGKVMLWHVKMPYCAFANIGEYEKLSIKDKLRHDILSFDDVSQFKDKDDLTAAADYYYDSHGMLSYAEGIEYLTFANLITDIIIAKGDKSSKHHIRKLDIISSLNRDMAAEIIYGHLETIRSKMYSFKEEDKLSLAEYFYFNADKHTEPEMVVNFLSLSVGFFESLIEETECRQCAVFLYVLSYRSMLKQEFEMAMDAIQLSIKADPDSDLAYSYLPICYVLTDRLSKAKMLFNQYRNKNFDDKWGVFPEATTYEEVFMMQIDFLEETGITHPDFDKVRELLDNS